MKIIDLITRDGKFSYDVFNKLDSDQREYLIDLYKTFLETYSSLNFAFSDKGFRVVTAEDQQEYYCRNYFSDNDEDEYENYIPYFNILDIEGVDFIEPRFHSIYNGNSYFIANYEEI